MNRNMYTILHSIATCAIIFAISKAAIADPVCTGISGSEPSEIHKANKEILSGNYQKFLEVVDKSIGLEESVKKNFFNGLTSVSADGFTACRLIAQENISSVISRYLFEFRKNNSIIFFSAVTFSDQENFPGGIVQFEISTDFTNIFKGWR